MVHILLGLTLGRSQSPRRRLAAGGVQLVLTELNLPDGRGIELVQPAQRAGCALIVITDEGSEELAVEALKGGASDYLVKSPQGLSRLPSARATPSSRPSPPGPARGSVWPWSSASATRPEAASS